MAGMVPATTPHRRRASPRPHIRDQCGNIGAGRKRSGLRLSGGGSVLGLPASAPCFKSPGQAKQKEAICRLAVESHSYRYSFVRNRFHTHATQAVIFKNVVAATESNPSPTQNVPSPTLVVGFDKVLKPLSGAPSAVVFELRTLVTGVRIDGVSDVSPIFGLGVAVVLVINPAPNGVLTLGRGR